jgi:aryl-alcohol dehydrogenase-like predicted oxidoreductase
MSSPTARAFVTGLLDDRHFDIADETAAIADELGTTSATVALAWLRDRPGITSVVLGPRSADQLAANLAGLAFDLPDALTTRLNAASQCTAAPAVTGQHRAA